MAQTILKRLALGAATTLALATGAQADQFKVVTTFTILADMVQNVAGDAAEVVSITKPGAEIHGYQPTPQDIVRASGADLILWNGMNLERWFEQFIANLGDMPSAVLSDGVDPVSIAEGDYEGLPNPHGWMGVDNAMVYVDNIRDALSEHDPDNAETYAANAETYKQQITDTVGPLRDRIKALPENRRWLVTCEGAFSYLTRDFDLKEAYLWPINADQTGTPQQVRRVIDTVRDNDIPAVFCESTVNQSPAQQVARETGASYGGMLYVDSLSAADGPVPTYLDLLRIDAETIANALAPAAN
ncbi:metal ABC transporter substrate-binding protein [Sulfitobacter sp. BDSS02]|uniref:metal ABC transporter substrate-binding protein n=1 Tax=Heliomarina TaxID=2917553 RepID=UPI001EE19A76|nr:metal ABC transporter substrate-binding protein [Heliomarina baculiformis]MBL3704689.1 metal ABC transporter substrate-binding protein [Sulfitobacter sp. BDSS02]MBR9850447.1 metal ABC transporter substrate-binding protein [Paracoccaceae bacterium]